MLFFLVIVACISLIGMTLLFLRSEKEKEHFRANNVKLIMDNNRLNRENFDLKQKETVQAYEALDQGMTEVQDAYATDSLQYEESLGKAHDEIVSLKAQKQHLEEELAEITQAALDMQVMMHPIKDIVEGMLEEAIADEEK